MNDRKQFMPSTSLWVAGIIAIGLLIMAFMVLGFSLAGSVSTS
ncbi:MAG: hypothetical protein QME75_00570 [Deltaproteobacteria bacterium]|nr:hypothetical protein [Deltaproteobacteria bacterium]